MAGAGAGGNCSNASGVINSAGHNLESTNTCGFWGTGDLINTDPLLGPLQDNGGSTHTHALIVPSLAINGGTNSGCPATDQRGISRPQGATCDIGAFEYIFGTSANLSLTKVDHADPVTVGEHITYTLTISNAGPDGALNVILTDNLPGATNFVSVTPSGNCGHNAGVVTCNLGTLVNGGQLNLQIVAATTAPGTVTNTASVISDTF